MAKVLTAEEILLAELSEGEKRLTRFCWAVEKGNMPDDALLRELSGAFREILAGVPPKKALDIGKNKGRKPPTAHEVDSRELPVAMRVILKGLKPKRPRRFTSSVPFAAMREGVRRDDAIEKVAAEIHKSEKTVSRYYERNKSMASFILDSIARAQRKQDKK